MSGYLPDSDSEDELPPGWEERATDDGHVFFVNHQNKNTQWTHPRTGKAKKVSGELPIGWEKTIDEDSNKIIFKNTTTNQITYTDPRLAFATEEASQNISNVRQRFDSCTTAFQVLHGKDLSGNLAVVTGSNGGIGFETARSLALHGCEVVFACRNQIAAEEAIDKISKEKPNVGRKCRFVRLDLCSLKSVKNFVNEMKGTVRHINFLILNAAVFGLPYSTTEDGLETTFQVCHLSHFYLTLQLDDLFDHNTRIIVVSSESHRFSSLSLENISEDNLSPHSSKYWTMMAYNNAKLCNVLFSIELAKKLKNRGISVFVLHPGNMVSSNLCQHWWGYRLLFAIVRPFTKSLQQAASTTVYCSTANELTGLTGLYFNNCFFTEPSKLAQNDELQKKLWELSESMIERILNK